MTHLKFKSLMMRNLMSFGNAETIIDFDENGSHLVVGENLDNGGANGCGKTSVINAICFALYNKPFDDISLQQIINSTNALKNTMMEVRLELDVGEDAVEIYRCRGERTDVRITMNGEDVTLDSINENDKLIEALIGVSYDLFTKVVIFSGNSEPFLKLPVAMQRQHIEELFNITLLSEKAQVLKERIKMTENDVAIQEAIVREQENAAKAHVKRLEEAQQRILKWESDRESRVERLSSQLKSIEGVDFDAEQRKHTRSSSLRTSIERLRGIVRSQATAIRTITVEISKLETELKSLVESKCPYCGQQLHDVSQRIEDIEACVATKRSALETAETESKKTNEELTAEESELLENDATINNRDLASLLKIRDDATTMKSQLAELALADNPHLEAFESLESTAAPEPDSGRLDELKSLLAHQTFLLKLLTDKNSFVRKQIINRSVPFLNARLNEYTTEIGLPHIVKFNSDMTCTVTEFGRVLGFGNLSAGEKKRVNLAMSLAFRDVLHLLHARVNLLFVDELDGGSLDTAGVDAVAKLLKRKCRDDDLTMWVISHRPEMVGRFDHEVRVIKENGFSRIER